MSRLLRRFRRDERGVAAIETALLGTLLFGALMNVVEVSRYAYVSTQVAAATQAGAQATVIACDVNQTPVTTKCSNASSAVQAALSGSTLGDKVKLVSGGGLTESWYCPAADGLQKVGAAGDTPSTCAGGAKPGLYVHVTASYDYTPLFPGLTIVETFSDSITRSAWMRTL